jgi:hypothetical protein
VYVVGRRVKLQTLENESKRIPMCGSRLTPKMAALMSQTKISFFP